MKLLLALGAIVVPLFGVQPEKPARTPPEPVPEPAVAPEQSVDAAWGTRLAALTPAEPMGYFLLGEEVAAEVNDMATRDLARQLLVLAYELDAHGAAAARERARLGPSVCLALASIATRDDERRWLRALAETLSDRPAALGSPSTDGAGAFPPDTAFDLATAMGLARAGEGRRAEQLIEKPAVAELLERFDSTPMPDGSVGGMRSFFKRAIRDWPVCPQCRNKRTVPAGVNRSGEAVLCDTCRGNPGPKLTEEEMAGQLRIEAMFLQGEQRSWAAQVLADGGAPLRDLDASELAGTYGVDPAKSVWRKGLWAVPAAAAPPAESPKPDR